MRIPFPERISLGFTTAFAVLLCVMQQVQGTSLIFSLCSFVFITGAVLAFNTAGGFRYPSGAYIFFYSTLGVIVGLVWKAVLWEAADTNLLRPVLTMEVYAVAIMAMLAAVQISSRLRRRQALLQNMLSEPDMRNAIIGCLIVGATMQILPVFYSKESGGVISALAQLNRFLPMAIILGVTHQIRRTQGRHSVTLLVVAASLLIFLLGGVFGFSKEGFFTPLLCWAVAAGAQRYSITPVKLAVLALLVFLTSYYMVPYSQYGRSIGLEGTFSERRKVVADLLGDLNGVRKLANAEAETFNDDVHTGYFNTPQGFVDRLQMITPDDSLIDVTETSGVFGLSPMVYAIENIIPHFLWKDKPQIGFGNLYTHEMGGLADDDFTTGISFTPSGEAFHMARWTGVLLIAPIVWACFFTLYDSLCGDTRKSPWGLLATVMVAHQAPEGMLEGVVYLSWFGSIGIIFAAFAAAYVMPLIGILVAGPGPRRRPTHSLPRRVLTELPDRSRVE